MNGLAAELSSRITQNLEDRFSETEAQSLLQTNKDIFEKILSVSGIIKGLAKPAKNSASGGCFARSQVVKTRANRNEWVDKPLADIKVNDLVSHCLHVLVIYR